MERITELKFQSLSNENMKNINGGGLIWPTKKTKVTVNDVKNGDVVIGTITTTTTSQSGWFSFHFTVIDAVDTND